MPEKNHRPLSLKNGYSFQKRSHFGPQISRQGGATPPFAVKFSKSSELSRAAGPGPDQPLAEPVISPADSAGVTGSTPFPLEVLELFHGIGKLFQVKLTKKASMAVSLDFLCRFSSPFQSLLNSHFYSSWRTKPVGKSGFQRFAVTACRQLCNGQCKCGTKLSSDSIIYSS